MRVRLAVDAPHLFETGDGPDDALPDGMKLLRDVAQGRREAMDLDVRFEKREDLDVTREDMERGFFFHIGLFHKWFMY